MIAPSQSPPHLDCLFVHQPKMHNYYKPLGEFIWINYMPMGLLAIADWVDRHGHPSRIVHCGIEWIENPQFSIAEYVAARKPPVVAMSLHWHQQAYDVIEAAKKIRAASPHSFIVLGGFTAAYYHEELVRDYDCIDAVIRGDGEIPMLELVRAIVGRRQACANNLSTPSDSSDRPDLSAIPNLTWRRIERGGVHPSSSVATVVVNPLTYVGTRDIVNRLHFANMPLLEHYETYVRYIGLPFVYAKNESKQANYKKYTIQSPLFPLCVGRGCPVDCSYCGGSKSSQLRISGRHSYFYRSIDAVIETILEAKRYGYETMHTCYDPEPRLQKYYVRLWRELRRRGIQTEWFFECNALPSREMIDEFALTFPSPKSVIALSAETGSERVRKANRGFHFSNQELLDTIAYIDGKGISMEVFFTYGIPFETEADLQATIQLRGEIARRFKHVTGMRALSIELEPGAPWQMEPEKYGIRTNLRTFRDYYLAHSIPTEGTYSRFGYYIPNYFGNGEGDEKTFAERLQAIKCKHFCFIHPSARRYWKPWKARMLCRVSSLLAHMRSRRNPASQ
ncbi:MAG: radical SAM protein [Candidatus Sumerlaeia bacterium]|nr:radical SAM protein [Candidatus Sumerlaeia bacterium]